MSEYSELLKQAKKEINLCITIWKNLLIQNYAEVIEYAYTKGSATKQWDSCIDYVPILSDVDIHIKIHDHSKFFDDETSFYEAVSLPELYENKYIEMNPDYLHIPRIQIIVINRIIELVDFVYPREHEIISLIGKPILLENPPIEKIKKHDLQNLLTLKEFLPTLSLSMIDRTGLELWTVIRRMNWKISPAPIRLLSQIHEDPLSLWALNRTKIVEELEKQKFHKIAEIYTEYYNQGWVAFRENFSNSHTLRKLISLGFEVLQLCLKESKKFV